MDEPSDYTAEITDLFARFRPEADRASTGRSSVPNTGLNHVEAGVVDVVARMWPEPFAAMTAHTARHAGFPDPVVERLRRECRFFLSYLDYIEPIRRRGLSFCFPTLVEPEGAVEARESFDLALARKLSVEGLAEITNDVSLRGPERILVVTGPNQGGKTTFARMVGQLCHLASVGVPVPGRNVAMPLVDRVLTHFEKVEDLDDPRGKLEDDLQRLLEVLQAASPRSAIICNEVLTSTSLEDARQMGTMVLQELTRRGVLAVYVTFVDKLASLGPSTVSMVSQVDPGDPSQRTFKVVRQPASGVAFAQAIAARYGLTQSQVRERIRP